MGPSGFLPRIIASLQIILPWGNFIVFRMGFKSLLSTVKILMNQRFIFNINRFLKHFGVVLPRRRMVFILKSCLLPYLRFHLVLGLIQEVVEIRLTGLRYEAGGRFVPWLSGSPPFVDSRAYIDIFIHIIIFIFKSFFRVFRPYPTLTLDPFK